MELERQPTVLSDDVIAVHIGADLAMTHDWTALCVVAIRERIRLDPKHADFDRPGMIPPVSVADMQARAAKASRDRETHYQVQLITKWPHDMSANQTATALVNLIKDVRTVVNTLPQERRAIPISIYADATGLGKPMLSIFHDALKSNSLDRMIKLYGLTFVHGERFDKHKGVMGKTYLLSHLQALFATGRLEGQSSTPEVTALKDEVQHYQYQISQDGRESWGGVGAHDDLVTALALACVDDPHQYMVSEGPRMFPGAR